MYHSGSMADMARAHEIMAKFRPIAPKPSLPPTQLPLCLKSRPCRARKRPRAASTPGSRQRHHLLPLPLPPPPPTPNINNAPPVEQDLLNKLQQQPRIVVPRPVRPVGSCIRVLERSIGVTARPQSPTKKPSLKEVEEDVESESSPAVVSDGNKRVRLVNSAYKEMVGQPECMWLESVSSSRRINGEVILAISEDVATKTEETGGFSCRVKVEWTACNGKKSFVDAPCDVVRVLCDSEERLFTWRIHTAQAFEASA